MNTSFLNDADISESEEEFELYDDSSDCDKGDVEYESEIDKNKKKEYDSLLASQMGYFNVDESVEVMRIFYKDLFLPVNRKKVTDRPSKIACEILKKYGIYVTKATIKILFPVLKIKRCKNLGNTHEC